MFYIWEGGLKVKPGDIVKFKYKDSEKIGYIIFMFNNFIHIKAMNGKKQYYVGIKDIITII